MSYTSGYQTAWQSATAPPILADSSGTNDCTLALSTQRFTPSKLLFPVGVYRVGAGIAPGGYAVVFNNTPNGTESTAEGQLFKGAGTRLSMFDNEHAQVWTVGVFGTVGGGPFNFNAELYDSFGGMGFSSITGVAYGLFITGCCFFCLKDCEFYQMANALQIDQCVSCEFDNITAKWGQNGVITTGGTTSLVNALLFKSCRISHNSLIGFNGRQASANITFLGCNFEENGTTGNNATGAVFANFDGGSEGAVGYNFTGCYFEGNMGQADIVLVNSSTTNYVTVNITGCNFNRNDAVNYVTHNIVTTGAIYLVLTSCAFKGFGTYVPNAAHTYVNSTDGNLTVKCLGCVFGNAGEQGTLVNL